MPDVSLATAAAVAFGIAGALLARLLLDRSATLPTRQQARVALALGRKWWDGGPRRRRRLFRSARSGGTGAALDSVSLPDARLRFALRKREPRQFWPPLSTR